MNILNLKPNTDEWLKHRSTTFNASEAPALMGESPYMTRTQLLDDHSGWVKPEETNWFKKHLLEKGHKFEDTARPHIEMDLMIDLPPVVGTTSIEGIEHLLGASLDGYCESPLHVWEHKSWNKNLVENVENAQLEPFHYWQLEHQCIVVGTDRVLFTVSDGTFENRRTMTYVSDKLRRNELIEAWKQFEKDLASHKPKAKKSVVIDAPAIALPAIVATLNGVTVNNNLSAVIEQCSKIATEEMGRELISDFDFSSKENLNKAVKKARQSLKEKVSHIENGFESFAEFKAYAEQLDTILQKLQSDGEKKVKAEKEARKQAIIDQYRQEVIDHLIEESSPFSELDDSEIYMPEDFTPDFKSAIKGKRTLSSMESACSDLSAKSRSAITKTAELVTANYGWLKLELADHAHLFPDLARIINQPSESFAALCKARVSEAQAKANEASKAKAEAEKTPESSPEQAPEQAPEPVTEPDSVKVKGKPTGNATAGDEPSSNVKAVWIEQSNEDAPATISIQFDSLTFKTKIDMNDGPTTIVSKLDQLAREIQARVK